VSRTPRHQDFTALHTFKCAGQLLNEGAGFPASMITNNLMGLAGQN